MGADLICCHIYSFITKTQYREIIVDSYHEEILVSMQKKRFIANQGPDKSARKRQYKRNFVLNNTDKSTIAKWICRLNE